MAERDIDLDESSEMDGLNPRATAMGVKIGIKIRIAGVVSTKVPITKNEI